MICEDCEKRAEPVPFIVHEQDMARQEREIERLHKTMRIWVIVLSSIIVLLLCVIGFFVYELNQYETIEITQENEDGYNNYIGNDGDIYNGEANDQDSPS